MNETPIVYSTHKKIQLPNCHLITQIKYFHQFMVYTKCKLFWKFEKKFH